MRRCVGDIHSNLTQLVLTLCGEENGKSFLNRQVITASGGSPGAAEFVTVLVGVGQSLSQCW